MVWYNDIDIKGVYIVMVKEEALNCLDLYLLGEGRYSDRGDFIKFIEQFIEFYEEALENVRKDRDFKKRMEEKGYEDGDIREGVFEASKVIFKERGCEIPDWLMRVLGIAVGIKK